MARLGKKRNNEGVILNINNPLFNYIKPKNNDMFSKMSGIDLQDLIYYLDNYYLELRNRLGFDDSVTFGLELEFENCNQKSIKEELVKLLNYSWILKDDSSLEMGGEINSPILKDRVSAWKNLKKVCSVVNRNAVIGPHCGGHVHIGTQVIGENPKSWINFIKLWSVYENIIYRFSYGNYLSARDSIRFARPLAEAFWNYYEIFKDVNKINCELILNYLKKISGAINFGKVENIKKMIQDNTIEFRCPNGTLDPVIWQNNVNLFINILLYSKSSRYNDDIIQKRRNINEDKYFSLWYNKSDKSSNLKWYDEIYLQQALELCDMIYTNNYDKVYFLKQYLKSFQVGHQSLVKAKKFTKY